jgi:hypothetical protein
MPDNKFLQFATDVVSALFWSLLIVILVVFSNVSTAQFIYNKF